MQLRPTTRADHAALAEVCIKTGLDGGDATGAYRDPTVLVDIYLAPYLTFEPEYAWSVDDDGTAAGYLVGTADTARFEQRLEREWWPPLRERRPLGSAPPGSRDEAAIRLIHRRDVAPRPWLAEYPAHLHIDLLPSTQGFGMGRRLIEEFERALIRRGVRGVHLGVSTTNRHAVGFYHHLGFGQIESSAGGMVVAKTLRSS